MDRSQRHRWLARGIAGVLGAGVLVAAFAPPGEVPKPPMRTWWTPELTERCAQLHDFAGGGIDTSDLAGVDEAVPGFEGLDGDVARRIVPPSPDADASPDGYRSYGEPLDQGDDTATVVVDVVRYDGTLGDLRRAFADQADELGWSIDDESRHEDRQRGVLFDFTDVYELPDGRTVAREGTACSGDGWYGVTRTVVPISRTGPCAPKELQPRCERVLGLGGLGGGSGFAELGGHELAVDEAGAVSVTYHVVDDSGIGRKVMELVEALQADGWAWTNRPPDCPTYEYDPFEDFPPPPPPVYDEDTCFDDFERGNLFFWDIPVDRPTSLAFTRTAETGVQTIDATFTPVLGSDDADGVDSNDIEAGYDATVTIREADAPPA